MDYDDNDDSPSDLSNIVPLKNGRSLKSLQERLDKQNSLSKKDKYILFAQGIADGFDVEAAYIKAFGQCRPTVARKQGDKLVNNPKVSDLIRAERLKRQTKGIDEGDRLRLFLVSRLEYEAIHAKSDTARISALRMIGELGHVKAFDSPAPGSVAELPADMEKRLADLMKKIGIEKPKEPDKNILPGSIDLKL